MSEHGTRPDDVPTWATDASARLWPDVASAPEIAARRASGWVLNNEPPPLEVFNYQDRLTGEWIEYFDEGRPRTFDDLTDAHLAGGVDKAAAVGESSDNVGFMGQRWATGSASGDGAAVTTSGGVVFAVYHDTIAALERSSANPLWTKTEADLDVGLSFHPVRIHCDGARVAIGTDFTGHGMTPGAPRGLAVLDADDGSVIWREYKTEDVTAVRLAGGFLFVARGSTGDVDCRDAVTGATIWTYNHGARVYAIATNGERIYIGGESSGGFFVRALDWAGSLLVSGSGHGGIVRSIVYHPTGVFVAGDDNAGVQIVKMRHNLGVTLWSGVDHGADLHAIALHDGLIWAAGGEGASGYHIRCYNPDTGELGAGADVGAPGDVVVDMAADPGGVFIAIARSDAYSIQRRNSHVAPALRRKTANGRRYLHDGQYAGNWL